MTRRWSFTKYIFVELLEGAIKKIKLSTQVGSVFKKQKNVIDDENFFLCCYFQKKEKKEKGFEKVSNRDKESYTVTTRSSCIKLYYHTKIITDPETLSNVSFFIFHSGITRSLNYTLIQ